MSIRDLLLVMPLTLILGLPSALLAAPAAPAPAPAAQPKLPIPDRAAWNSAYQQVQDVFARDIAAAKTPEAELALGARLARVADETTDQPPLRYVLLQLAAKHTARGGQPAAALGLLDRLGQLYQVNLLSMKADLLIATADAFTKRGQSPFAPPKPVVPGPKPAGSASAPLSPLRSSPALSRPVGEGQDEGASLSLLSALSSVVDDAVADDDYAVASRLLDYALSGARKARNKDLTRDLTDRSREVDALRAEYARIAPALETLRSTPDDPAANLAAGQWFCFHKDDWPKGLPLLAKGADATLADLAKRELAASPEKEPRKLLEVGEAWLKVAKDKEQPFSETIEAHATSCFQLALPKLSGLDKVAAEKRLEEIAAAAAPPLGSSSRGVVQAGNVALASNGTQVIGIERNASELLDGKTTTFDADNGYAWSSRNTCPCEWTISFNKAYALREIRLLFLTVAHQPDRCYRYAITVSADGKTHVPLADRTQGEWKAWQVLEFRPRPVKSVRIIGQNCSKADGFHVVEFEAYCYPPRRPTQSK